jgi:hypothetical protein
MVQGGFVAQYFGAPVAVAVGGAIIILVAASVLVRSPNMRGMRAEMSENLQAAYAE